MSDDPWAVAKHADAPHPKPKSPDQPATSAPAKPPPKDDPATLQGTPIPMAMSLLIPPDFIAAISALVGAQAALTTAIAEQTKGLAEWTENMEAAIIAASPPKSTDS